jgi:hypothetical protein
MEEVRWCTDGDGPQEGADGRGGREGALYGADHASLPVEHAKHISCPPNTKQLINYHLFI